MNKKEQKQEINIYIFLLSYSYEDIFVTLLRRRHVTCLFARNVALTALICQTTTIVLLLRLSPEER